MKTMYIDKDEISDYNKEQRKIFRQKMANRVIGFSFLGSLSVGIYYLMASHIFYSTASQVQELHQFHRGIYYSDKDLELRVKEMDSLKNLPRYTIENNDLNEFGKYCKNTAGVLLSLSALGLSYKILSKKLLFRQIL